MTEQATTAADSEQAGTDGTPPRIMATPEALALIAELTAEHGPIMFHQSGGCCDGMAPMCFPAGDFQTGDKDVYLGQVGGADFFISGPQHDIWKHTQIILDVRPSRGGSFSLESTRDKAFDIRSRVLTQEEKEAVAASGACEIRPPA